MSRKIVKEMDYYNRLADVLRNAPRLGFPITLLPEGLFRIDTPNESDLYVFSKQYNPRDYVTLKHLGAAMKTVEGKEGH